MSGRIWRNVLRLLLGLGLLAGVVSAQNPASPPAVVKEPPTRSSGKVMISGSLRLRFEDWDWFESRPSESNYAFGAATLRIGLSQQSEQWEWQLEAAAPLLLGLPARSIAPGPAGQLGLGGTYFAANGERDGSIFIKQASIRLKNPGGMMGTSLKIGRFEFNDGLELLPADPSLATIKRDHISQRLIGAFGFTHIGRSFDGLHLVRQTKGGNLTIVGARPTEGVFQLRGWNQLDVDFYYGAYTRPQRYKSGESDLRLFVLHYHDGRRVLKTDNRALALRASDNGKIRLTTIGGHYIGVRKAGSGKADLLVWWAGQYGSWGSLDHRSGAIAVEGGYQFGASRLNPWLRGGLFRSTGDDDPDDGRHGTFFQALPTPRIYARFPFFDSMNLEDLSLEFRIKPHRRLALRADLHELRLSNPRDLWYLGGGAFQQKTFGFTGRPANGRRRLGTLVDLSADLTINPSTSLTFYIGHADRGAVPTTIYQNGQARFSYLELTRRF